MAIPNDQAITASSSASHAAINLVDLTRPPARSGVKSVHRLALNYIPGPPFTPPFTPTEGVVATLNPLTITTPDKKTITVNIADDTRISKSKDAASTDVKADMFGSGIVKGTGDTRVLTELHLIQIPANND